MTSTSESELGARPTARLGPRHLGRFNRRGLWTLYCKEVKRFLSVFTQTVIAPAVTMLLFLAIFTLALGRGGVEIGGVPYSEFLAPGLVMMAIIQHSFANTSSSLLISKVQGNIVDVLMPPLSAGELTLGFLGGGVTRGAIVGIVATLGMWIFVPVRIHDPLAVLWFGLNAALLLSLLGMIGGIWADKFDHIAGVTNFVIVPFSFLSGTFYSVERLPESWRFVAHLNPFFYQIDGFRYGFIGHHDGNLTLGAILLGGINLCLFLIVYRMFASGYKLKA